MRHKKRYMRGNVYLYTENQIHLTMIIDSVNRLGFYTPLNPLFDYVVKFLAETDLSALTPGRHDIYGDKVYVNVCTPDAKTADEAVMESHRQMIDIHVPITAPEKQGFLPADAVSQQPYDQAGDYSIHPDAPSTYYTLPLGQMAIHFPGEGHSPAISPTPFKKAIFKVYMGE